VHVHDSRSATAGSRAWGDERVPRLSADHSCRLLASESLQCVGGTVESRPDLDGYVLVAALEMERCWGGAAGWVILEVHADDVGVCRARIDPTFDPVVLTRRWALGPPEPEESWIPQTSSLGRLGAKVGGRPGWLQDAAASATAGGRAFLAQIDCETSILYEAQQALLCDGAVYLFGKTAENGALGDLRLYWQV
jgi:hypothetical protein